MQRVHSSTVDYVASYLCQLKKDICVGQEGYFSYVVLGGDKQIYSILKNLKPKHLDVYGWVFPVPGDWHFLKTMSEVLRNLLWDRGFHDLAAKCGTKKDVTRWQDIRRILVYLLDELLRSVLSHLQQNDRSMFACVSSDKKAFQQHSSGLFFPTIGTRCNKACAFWQKAIYYLTVYFGYYFAIRNGNVLLNWFLRNSCLK